MAVVIRPANAEEMEQYHFVNQTVFAADRRDSQRHSIWNQVKPEWTLCAFEDGQMATSFAAFPYTQKLNGADVAVAAVTGVGTLPHKRRRGYLRAVMVKSFGRYRDEGRPLAILTASLAAIYQRFGYAHTAPHMTYRVDPREIGFAAGPRPTGSVRLSGKDELPLLRSLYERFIADRSGPIQRDDLLWETQTLQDTEKEYFSVQVAVYEEEGEALGYVVYQNETHDHGDWAERWQRLTMRELIWLRPSAYVALWEHLAAHDLVFEIRARYGNEDDPLFYLLEEPRRLNAQSYDEVFTRIVDVEAALSARSYGQAASLAFEVFDNECDWNRGVWELESDGPRAEARRSQRAPQISLSVHSLAALLCGTLSATELADLGRLEVADHASLPDWDRAFAVRGRPFLLNAF